ncbi:MAG: glycoside hydrolase family 27 protein [Lachnospiraceae bacterium]|nr:glycoside hydrolase family 27 protein [Lachnospiraceae bacterium]
MKRKIPGKIPKELSFDCFDDGSLLYGKEKNRLPAMGWNSWNAFGSGNTEELTKAMADRICALGLKELGYRYVVLDDGCYRPERVNGRLSNDEAKFPGGFRALSDHLHKMGLLFGMYNDVGTRLCAGAEVGTCGHEKEDAKTYIEWGVDFLKVDNCYYPYDNATFSDPENARFVFAPNIRSVRIESGRKPNGRNVTVLKAADGVLTGPSARITKEGYATGIGTFDGTGPKHSPVGVRSSELIFETDSPEDRDAFLSVEYATGKRERVGQWLQIAVNDGIVFDGLLDPTDSETSFVFGGQVKISLRRGRNRIRLMNHRRQENTLKSYATLLKYLKREAPDKDIVYSACEWGKTQPQNWAKKVCDSWRILNDITFRVGKDGDPGHGDWDGDYTCSVTSQYNKAVIMDGFAGLGKGWNDPDMLMIGMEGLTLEQNRTHMVMWCMMNAPLMLGLDLRRVKKGDDLYRIIADRELIKINQDPLGIQAKRVFSSLAKQRPDRTYIRDTDRVDILAKPLSGGRFAISFINLGKKKRKGRYSVDVITLKKYFKEFMSEDFARAKDGTGYDILDVRTGKKELSKEGVFSVRELSACGNVTMIVTPAGQEKVPAPRKKR